MSIKSKLSENNKITLEKQASILSKLGMAIRRMFGLDYVCHIFNSKKIDVPTAVSFNKFKNSRTNEELIKMKSE